MPKNRKRPYGPLFSSPGILVFTAIFAAIGTFFILRTVAYNQGGNYDVRLVASNLDTNKGTVQLSWSTPLVNNNLRYCLPNTAIQKIGSNFSNQNVTEWTVVGNSRKSLSGNETVYFFGGTRGYYHTYSLTCYNSQNYVVGFSNPATVSWR